MVLGCIVNLPARCSKGPISSKARDIFRKQYSIQRSDELFGDVFCHLFHNLQEQADFLYPFFRAVTQNQGEKAI